MNTQNAVWGRRADIQKLPTESQAAPPGAASALRKYCGAFPSEACHCWGWGAGRVPPTESHLASEACLAFALHGHCPPFPSTCLRDQTFTSVDISCPGTFLCNCPLSFLRWHIEQWGSFEPVSATFPLKRPWCIPRATF